MTNFERLKEQLKEFLTKDDIDDLVITIKGDIGNCCYTDCDKCLFRCEQGACDHSKLIDYLASECKEEPVKLQRLEWEVLKKLYSECFYWLVINDDEDCIYAYSEKPVYRDEYCENWKSVNGDDGLRFPDFCVGNIYSIIRDDIEQPVNIFKMLQDCEVIEE